MTFRFDLVTEPWVPCVLPDGRTAEYGLLETLARAREIKAITHPYPPVAVALHRLLLAILHRNFGPPTVADWKRLYRAGRWDEGALVAYFDRWSDRFDLFHPKGPFYQVPTLQSKGEPRGSGYKPMPVHKLAAAEPHFTQSYHRNPPLPPAECARLVVAYQAFFVGGLVSRLKGERPSGQAGPVAKGAVVTFEGDNLFETLMFNLLVYNPESGEPFP